MGGFDPHGPGSRHHPDREHSDRSTISTSPRQRAVCLGSKDRPGRHQQGRRPGNRSGLQGTPIAEMSLPSSTWWTRRWRDLGLPGDGAPIWPASIPEQPCGPRCRKNGDLSAGDPEAFYGFRDAAGQPPPGSLEARARSAGSGRERPAGPSEPRHAQPQASTSPIADRPVSSPASSRRVDPPCPGGNPQA